MSADLDLVRFVLDRVSMALCQADGDAAQLLAEAEDGLLDLDALLVVHPLGVPLLPLAAGPARARAERLIRHIHDLGPRAVGELLDALARRHDLADEFRAELEAFGRISAEQVTAAGARDFAPSPVREVRR